MDFVVSFTLWFVLAAGWGFFVLSLCYIHYQKRDMRSLALGRDHYKRLLTMLDDEPLQTLEEVVLEASYAKKPAGYVFQDKE